MNFDPATTSPQAAQDILTQIAQLLGLDVGASHDDIAQSLDALFAAITGEKPRSGADERAAASHLTAAQQKMCRELGCSYSTFLRLKTGRASA